MNNYQCSRIKIVGSLKFLILPKKGECSLIIHQNIGKIVLKIACSSEIYNSRVEDRHFEYKVIIKFKKEINL